MRLFISCELESTLQTYLLNLAKQLPDADLKIPSIFDLTIKFLGETSPESAEEIQRRISSFHFSPFEAHLSAINVFSPHNIRVVWVGVQPTSPFISLHNEIENLLELPSNPEFVPHITLARVKSLPNKKKFLKALETISVEPIQFTIGKLIVFKSELSSHGAVHTPLACTGT